MDTTHMDATIGRLSDAKNRWADLPIDDKIRHLDGLKDAIVKVARPWVEAAVKAKGLSMSSPVAGEEWTSGPFSVLWYLKDLRATLVRLATGVPVLDGYATRTLPSGLVAVDVFPKNFDEGLLFSGITAEVWMQEGSTIETIEESAAAFYRSHADDRKGNLQVVLGAGNISSIPVLDVIYALFVEGKTAILKLNPVNDYLGSFFESVFAEMIDDGYVGFVYGDADVGAYLTEHELVDSIHITGSSSSYNAIVFGRGADGEANRLSDAPVNTKPLSAELGGVTPVIVTPGQWSKRDLRFQAEHVVSQKLHNSGFNCVAAQVLVLPRAWDQKGAFLDEVRAVMREADDRPAYYPGAKERCERAVAASGVVEAFGDEGSRFLVTHVDPNGASHAWFGHEIFAPMLAVTELPGADPASFLMNAVAFANDRLNGTLGANIIVDPKTERAYAAAVERAIADLDYGTVTVNAWSGAAYFLGRCAWGARPGHARTDIQSGTGVVHNALMFDRPLKSIVRGPFAEAPRTFTKGEFHLGPKMVYFVTNRKAHVVGEKLIAYCDEPSKAKLASIALSAMRG
ncbi:MAG: aldehyde dehydrogenase family protein [Acidimicrobiia bacterium]